MVGGTQYHAFGAGAQRANSTGISAGRPGRAQDFLSAWFDKAQFTKPEPFTLGNLGRVLPDVRTDGLNQWDPSMAKRFPIAADRVRLEYRAFWQARWVSGDDVRRQNRFVDWLFGLAV